MSQGAPSPILRSTDPLYRFPYETWLHCMKFAVEESASGPLPYLAVSPGWSAAIIGSPSLWTSIVIDNGEDEAARVQVFIQLSQPQLVDILYIDSKDGNILHYALRECSSRVSSLVYSPRPPFLDTHEDLFLMVLNEITSEFIALRTLIGVHNAPAPRRLLSASPNLRIIREFLVSAIDEPYMSLMVEEVQMDFENTLDIFRLSQRRRLRSLCTTLHSITPSFLDEDTESTSQTIVQQLSINLGYQLISLNITLSLESFWTFVTLLVTFLRLHSLALSVHLTKIISRHEVVPIALGTIRSLSLKFQSRRERFNYNETHAFQAQGSTILRSFTAENALKRVETLYFRSDFVQCSEDDLGRWIRSALDVRTLTVVSSQLIGGELFPRKGYPPMHSLNSALLDPPALFDLLNAPNLTDLTFPNPFMSSYRAFELGEEGFGSNLVKLSTTSVHLDPRPTTKSPYTPSIVAHTVKHLTITDLRLPMFTDRFNFDHFRKGRSSLQWLCEISFDSGDQLGSASPELANEFLYFLYDHPETCPHLAKIKTLGYPFWELLFEVIRQRYFSHVRRITHISLPRLPMYGILYLLVGCLGGREDAYSGKDIDEVISQRIDSKYNHACGRCTRGGYIYCVNSPPSAGEKMFDPSFREEQDIFHPYNANGHAMPYAFERLMEDPETRRRMQSELVCDWQLGYDWVDITGHTLDGEVFVTR